MFENHGKIIGMFGGCHHAGGALGAAIVACTTWSWRWLKPGKVSTHSSVGFIFEDGFRMIFEAREPNAWQGPIPVDKVVAWVAREPKKRRFTMYDIPEYMIDAAAAQRKYDRSQAMLRVWDYSVKQLPRMGVRKWLPFLPINATPNAVVCSEAATIILGPEVDVCKIVGKSKPDLINPFLFEKAMKAICAKPAHEPADVSNAYAN